MKIKKINYGLMLMIMISFMTQILSLFKSSIVAGSFGAGNEMDAYNLANNVVTFVFGFAASGISTIIIPEYANKRNKKAIDTFITVIYGSILIFVVLMIAMRIQLFGIFSSRGEVFTYLTANIFIILSLTHYLSSISNITVAYFQCEGKHNIPKIVTLICQILVIVVLLMFEFDIIQYTLIIAASLFLSFFVDIFLALKCGWRYRPRLLLDQDAKILLKRFAPVIVSTGIYQLTLLIDTTIASFLDAGKLSILSYSSQISLMVDSVLIGNLVIYLFPKITKRIHEVGYQKHFWEITASLHAIVCLVSAVFLTVGHEGVALLFQRGAFTDDASMMVFVGAAIYIAGNQISIVRASVYRYFYAIGNTNIPGINSILVSVLNIVVSIILVRLIGFYGIILGTVLVSLISLGGILVMFHKKIGFCPEFVAIIGRYIKSFLTFLLTVILVYLTKHCLSIANELVSLVLYGIETIGIYVLITFLFNKKTLLNLRYL